MAVVVVVEAGICRLDFRANLMHGRRRRRRLVAGSGRSDEKLRRRRLQLQHQLVRLSGRRFPWQLHRKFTQPPTQNNNNHLSPTAKKSNRVVWGEKTNNAATRRTDVHCRNSRTDDTGNVCVFLLFSGEGKGNKLVGPSTVGERQKER